MGKPVDRLVSFEKTSVYIKKALHVDGAYAGIKPQYQRAEVIPGGDCETLADWAEETHGVWDVAAAGSGRVGSNSIVMTQTGGTIGKSVYLLFSGPVDLSWAKYVGFWFKGKNAQVYAANDVKFYIFTDPKEYLYKDRTKDVDPFGAYNEENPAATWHYSEKALSAFTVASGKTGVSNLKHVWGIGFYNANLATTVTMQVDHIEFYTHGTGYGAARGRIMTAPIKDGVTLAIGNGTAWEIGSGRVLVSVDNEPMWAGICVAGGVGNEKGTVFADFVVDGPVNMKCNDTSIGANEEVCCSAAGTALTIDDGGAGAQGYEIGKGLEAGAIANSVITVMLGMKGATP